MIIQPTTNIDPGGSSSSVPPVALSYNNNNNSVNPNIKLKNTKNISISSRFASSQLSPELDYSDQLISLATLNVRGLSVTSKFNSFLQDLTPYDISFIGLQETRLREQTGFEHFKSFRSSFSSSSSSSDYDAY